jgi:hypothetical protein
MRVCLERAAAALTSLGRRRGHEGPAYACPSLAPVTPGRLAAWSPWRNVSAGSWTDAS